MAMRMPESFELRGICGVCALGEDCDQAKNCTGRMTDCERFEPDPGLVTEMVGFVIQSQTKEMPGEVEPMGLCENCEHRDNCAFPRNEGGVWHCEEYE